MEPLLSDSLWLICLGLIIGPFVQEDVAVVGAAGLSVAHPEHFGVIFAAIMVGLLASDLWKYWPGALARDHDWAKRYSARPKVAAAKDKMRRRPGMALMAVRFIPLTRVPAYMAAGFVKVPYAVFCGWVTLSGLIYVVLIFAAFHTLGMVLGEKLKTFFPLIGISLVLILLTVHYVHQKIRARSDP